jgi:class 3 adenylate cyclase
MTTLRATVVMKTDISGSTVRFRSLAEPDLTALLAEHHELLVRTAGRHHGRIVKSEGDGHWLVFPSVTAAALAAMAMQEDLRLAQPGKGDDRLAMRIVITLGDVLLQEGALVGDAVVLAARIESVTPPDEIHLSQAAWLAVSRAEVRTSPVDTFVLKGFEGPVPVYRVDQAHRTRVVEGQYIVITDLRGFMAFVESHSTTAVERVLDHLLELVGAVCRDFGGTTRFVGGDSYGLTFPEVGAAMQAVERLRREWLDFQQRDGFRCDINIAVHRGALNLFRSYLYGSDVNVVVAAESATHDIGESGGIFVTDRVRDEVADTPWAARLRPVELARRPRGLAGIAVYRLEGGQGLTL